MKPAWLRTFAHSLIGLSLIVVSGCEGRLLLDERFHDTRLLNWNVVDDRDTLEGPSEWRVEQDGWVHQRSNIWGRRGDFLGRWYGTLLIAGEDGWQNYSVSATAKPEDNDGFGIVFRYQDPEHFYRLLFLEDGLSGGPITRLDRREGADYTELWSAPKGYRPGNELAIEVTVDGDLIAAFADGKRLCEVKDGMYSRGKIGLFCYAQNGQAFDDVRVVSR